MDDTRRGEMALAILTLKYLEDGVTLKKGLRREAGDLAKKLCDIGFKTDVDEVMSFFEKILPKLLGRAFGYQRVSLNLSEPIVRE